MRAFALLMALLLVPGLAAAQSNKGSALERAKAAQDGSGDTVDKGAADSDTDSADKQAAEPEDATADDEEPAPDADEVNQTLGAKMFLTHNPAAFQKAWQAGEDNLPTTTSIGQANPVLVMLAISGCARGKDGKCSIQFTSRTAGPDGQFDAPRTAPPWKPAPMRSKPELAPASFGLRLGPADPAGRYTIEVKVTDLVAKTNRTVTSVVTKPAAAAGGR